MIFMPPRHGKSELASRRFPAWFLGRQPERSIIAASYNSDLASDFGREVRDIVGSREYSALFAAGLKPDSKAANRWHTTEGGMYVAAGVGTAVTGRGAHVLLIDDPFKDREEADSDKRRETVWRWYTSTAYTRLEGDFLTDEGELSEDDAIWADIYSQVERGDAEPFEGAIVVIQTRWHEDDLAGRLLAQMEEGADQWDILELPAINADGEALWEAKFPLERLEKTRVVLGARDWSALYQQKPAPPEGNYFHRDWLKSYTKPPPRETLRIYGGSDYAVTADGGDYTVHVIIGMDPVGRLYLLDLWRGQTDSADWIESFCDLVLKHKPIGWAEEAGQIKSAVGPFLKRRMQERKAFVHREQFPTRGDKAIRAQSIRGRMSMEGLYCPKAAPWYPEFERELLTFDAGVHDDQVDALGLVGQLLDRMVKGTKLDTTKKRPIDAKPTFNDAMKRHMKRMQASREMSA